MKWTSIYFTTLLLSLLSYVPNYGQYVLVGQTQMLDENCYQLTRNEQFTFGALWSEETIDLNFDFKIDAEVNFGTDDNGADGIAFAFQQVSNSSGENGAGLGIANVSPSLIVEMDTWQNELLNDPDYDHIHIFKNGNLNHTGASSLSGPKAAKLDNSNIEDGEYYSLDITWDASDQILSVFFDCSNAFNIPISYTDDVIENIFNGDPNVFWGFTAATGSKFNQQVVCINSVQYDSQFTSHQICPGGQIQLDALQGDVYQWTPSEGLSNPNIGNPIASPSQSTIYELTIQQDCNTFYQTFEVLVGGPLIDYDLGRDTTVCAKDAFAIGEEIINATYQWSNNNTEATQVVNETGLYTVTVTVNEECITEDKIDIEVLNSPSIDLGNDTLICTQAAPFSLQNKTFIQDFKWEDGSSLPIKEISDAGVYSMSSSNLCGDAFGEIRIDFEDCRNIYIPNIINVSDPNNNTFLIQGDDDIVLIEELNIYDRWGGLMFRNQNFNPNKMDMGWKASTKSNLAGVYAYSLRVLFKDLESVNYYGQFLLVK